MHIPITVNILSNDDNIKLNILNYLIRGILLLILVFSDVVSAENILPLADSFSGSLEKIFKDRFINYSIIKDLHTVEPVLRMEYQDLCLLDFQSANLFGAISGRTRGFSIIYPFLKHQQKATLSLSYKSTDNRMNMGSVQKKTLFSYQDRFKETRIQFSHFSDFFNLRWGIGLRLLEMDSDLETDPSLELEWGNISNLRIRLIVYQHSALIPQLWILRDESLKGDLHFQIDGFNAELLFGDVFGTQVRLISTDKLYNSKKKSIGSLITNNGEERSFRLAFNNDNSNRLNWSAEGSFSDYSGGLSFEKEDEIISNAPLLDWSSYFLGSEVRFKLRKSISMSLIFDYNSLKGKLAGLITSGKLPQAFQDVLGDTTLFQSNAIVKGPSIQSNVNWRNRFFKTGIETGIGSFDMDFQIDDIADLSTPVKRTNQFPIKNCMSGWLKLKISSYYRGFTIGGNISKVFFLKVTTYTETESPEKRKFSENWSAKIWINLAF